MKTEDESRFLLMISRSLHLVAALQRQLDGKASMSLTQRTLPDTLTYHGILMSARDLTVFRRRIKDALSSSNA